MSEIIKNRYLDFDGLKRYDALIKGLISSGNKELADAIAALNAKIGSLDIEGSDSKTLTEAIGDIYASIEEIVEKQGSLDDKDVEIEGKIFQASLETGYAERGESVKILRHEGGRLYCKKELK